MNTDDTYNADKNNVPANDGNKQDTPNDHKYRSLGASGLVEDEEGNIYGVDEIDEWREPEDPETTKRLEEFNKGVTKNTFVSQLDDKTNPAYWYFYYDERYCGPSREAYCEKMAAQARKEQGRQKRQAVPKSTDTPSIDKAVDNVRQSLEAKKQPKPTTKTTISSDTTSKATISSDSTSETKTSDPAFQAAKKKADEEQQAVILEGLYPLWKQMKGGPVFTGIVNSKKEVVISDKEYSMIGPFRNGLAVAHSRKTKKFGFIDRHGKEVIPCCWRSVGPFNEYMAAVVDEHKRCGYVDVTGRLVVQCLWDEGWPFQNGYARVQGNKKIGMIDQSGKLVVPCIWKGMGDFSEGLAGVQDDNGKCGYIDKTGKLVIPCRWKQVWTFCEGRAVVQDFNKRLGFIDTSGELVIPCIWKRVNYFSNGLAKVAKDRTFPFRFKWVYIDPQGRIVK